MKHSLQAERSPNVARGHIETKTAKFKVSTKSHTLKTALGQDWKFPTGPVLATSWFAECFPPRGLTMLPACSCWSFPLNHEIRIHPSSQYGGLQMLTCGNRGDLEVHRS